MPRSLGSLLLLQVLKAQGAALTEQRAGDPWADVLVGPKLPDGVYGRIDDMIHIRGENVYPTEVDNYLRGVDGYGGEHQIIVRRTGSMDEMIVRAETTHPAGQPAAVPPGTGRGRARGAAEAVRATRARVRGLREVLHDE